MQFEKHRIVHRDIKLENLYITEEGSYKLGDFGIAIRMDEAKTASKKGNKNYMAPEVFWEREYGGTTDTYSLGILMYMLANGNKMPFFDSEYLIALITKRKNGPFAEGFMVKKSRTHAMLRRI